MRKANETVLDSGLYTRLDSVQMSEADRQSAVRALTRAEQVTDAVLWLKKKIAGVGQLFLKPSLRA